MAPKLYSGVEEKKHYHKVDAIYFAIVTWECIHKLPFQGMSNLHAAYASAFKVCLSTRG
ncbi:putative dual-specificity kinase [Helianthus annuus]|uniref:Dual-specificity kinase n=1 Tax=Helianthus annuus TaxID=4232 RepID=A0A9K3NF49_HELAN|nr:putative dual-specificity kinase [Helianthus annuus]KAJ0549261.1 putative dual-specificity kinase [Helianthus annuus]KAJ0555557.1 putative dual-specificity kinase [Helianthus annuus]KAJ0562215.1 putative dual-specificity kinase [Helianthus annuus]KAJ0727589.1 putative dual-specificity kinase [Helianthus annuus]